MTYQNFLRKPFSGYSPNHSLQCSVRRRGQALIEMAFVVIILLFLTLGLIQYGLIANTKVTMANLAREGARFAAVNGTKESSDGNGLNADGTYNRDSIKGRVREIASTTNLGDIDDSNVEINPLYDRDNPRKSRDLITVTIKYDMKRKFILPSSFPGLSLLSGLTQTSATMVLE